MAADGQGGVYVTWYDYRNGQIDMSTYVQRLTAQGGVAPGWPALGVRTGIDSGRTFNAIMPDGAGGVFAGWGSIPVRDIYLQRIADSGEVASGWPAGGFLVCGAAGSQHYPHLASDGNGGLFVAWKDGRVEVAGDIYAARVESGGTIAQGWPIDGLPICSAPYEQGPPLIVADGSGGFFATWNDGRTYPWDLYVHHIGSDGQPVAGWQTNGNLYYAGPYFEVIEAMISDDAGGVYVLWLEDPYDSSGEMDFYLLRIGADGAVSPGWPPRGLPVCTAPGLQYYGFMTADGLGGAVMCWTDGRGGVYGLRINPDGSRATGWPENGLPVHTGTGFYFSGPVVSDGAGGAYFAMESHDPKHIYVQHLTAAGTLFPGWPASGYPASFGQGAYEDFPAMIADGLGGCIVAWEDQRPGAAGIYAQKFGSDGPTPVLLSLASLEAQPGRVMLTWHRSGSDVTEATVYRKSESADWLPIGRSVFDGSGVLRYEDTSVTPGRRYAYRLGVREHGAETLSDETWVDVPAALRLALDGLRPNPAVGELRVSLTLPRHDQASLELLDVSGRSITQREIGNLGPGQHLVSLGDTRDLSPGIYWLRLSTGETSLVARAAVIR